VNIQTRTVRNFQADGIDADPKCGTLHDVEAPAPWYPVLRDFEPDIDTFKDRLGLPIPERADAP
jgi:acetone carboxylase gamma subunit